MMAFFDFFGREAEKFNETVHFHGSLDFDNLQYIGDLDENNRLQKITAW